MTGQLSLSNVLHVYLEMQILRERIAKQILEDIYKESLLSTRNGKGEKKQHRYSGMSSLNEELDGGANEKRQMNDCLSKIVTSGQARHSSTYSRCSNRRTSKAQMAHQ